MHGLLVFAQLTLLSLVLLVVFLEFLLQVIDLFFIRLFYGVEAVFEELLLFKFFLLVEHSCGEVFLLFFLHRYLFFVMFTDYLAHNIELVPLPLLLSPFHVLGELGSFERSIYPLFNHSLLIIISSLDLLLKIVHQLRHEVVLALLVVYFLQSYLVDAESSRH